MTWKYFERNVLEELNADLALAVSEKGGADHSNQIDNGNPFRARAKYIWEIQDPEQDDYTPLYEMVANLCGVDFKKQDMPSCLGGPALRCGLGTSL